MILHRGELKTWWRRNINRVLTEQRDIGKVYDEDAICYDLIRQVGELFCDTLTQETNFDEVNDVPIEHGVEETASQRSLELFGVVVQGLHPQ